MRVIGPINGGAGDDDRQGSAICTCRLSYELEILYRRFSRPVMKAIMISFGTNGLLPLPPSTNYTISSP